MKILFLTSNNLATNPRLYKELSLAGTLKHSRRVVQFRLGNWSDEKTNRLLSDLNSVESNGISRKNTVAEHSIDATRDAFAYWFYWAFLEWIYRILYPFFTRNVFVNAIAQSRRSVQILHRLKSIKDKPELIIAHNLSTLYPAYNLSKKWKVPFIFDIEDYYPGEHVRRDAVHEKLRREFLMKRLLPEASDLTSASPFIREFTHILTGSHPNHYIILNSFPKSEFASLDQIPMLRDQIRPNSTPEELNFVWFSQKISFNRGLEQFFDAINLINISGSMEEKSCLKICRLTIIGEIDNKFEQEVLLPFMRNQEKEGIDIVIKSPMTQYKLHSSLVGYDVGLAIEPGKDLNNSIAISNKILAYAQSGLYILATDTKAQKAFIDEDPIRGIVSKHTPSAISESVRIIWQNRKEIKQNREERYNSGKSLAWENESQQLIKLWNEVLMQRSDA